MRDENLFGRAIDAPAAMAAISISNRGVGDGATAGETDEADDGAGGTEADDEADERSVVGDGLDGSGILSGVMKVGARVRAGVGVEPLDAARFRCSACAERYKGRR